MDDILRAATISVGDLVAKQARIRAGQTALVHGERSWTYRQLNERANRLANHLRAAGVVRGDRILFHSENTPAFVELSVAAARIGAIVAALNWRLNAEELRYCIDLVAPRMALVSQRMQPAFQAADEGRTPKLSFGSDYEAALAGAAADEPPAVAEPEDGIFIIYTSGTTGRPKGALISQRALIARMQLYCTEFGINQEDTFVAWSPMFHMAATDLSLGTVMIGGKVVVADGPDLELIAGLLESDTLSNLIFFPGMLEETIRFLRERRPKVRGVKKFGALADLLPKQDIAALTAALGVPFTNTYACTETGIGPASAGRIAPGVVPERLGKTESNFCLVRLVDAGGREVPDGTPGELETRGPAMFSGYWNNPEATREAFRDGWFRSGDLFRRNADGTLDYLDRLKYLIKSGGENIYPAEIERVVTLDQRIAEAVAVRRRDGKWGEVPVLFVVARDPAVTAEEVLAACAAGLARYKVPKEVLFVDAAFLPRNNTGKVLRHELEAWLAKREAAEALGAAG